MQKPLLKKRKTLQRSSLKVWQVHWLEEIACRTHTHGIFNQVAARFFCYLVYARANFSDGQASGDPSLDPVVNQDPPKGFREAAVCFSKTSFSLEHTRHVICRWLHRFVAILWIAGQSAGNRLWTKLGPTPDVVCHFYQHLSRLDSEVQSPYL